MNKQDFLTVKEVAKVIGCSDDWVRKLIRGGEIPAARPTSRLYLVKSDDLDAYLAAAKNKPVEPKNRTTTVIYTASPGHKRLLKATAERAGKTVSRYVADIVTAHLLAKEEVQ